MKLKNYVKNKSGGSKDCFAEALHYVTSIPRAGIPNFTKHEDFWEAVDSYLYAWDLKLAIYDPVLHSDVPHILCSGDNERGIRHVVVYENDELVYDPFPKGGAIRNIEDRWVVIPARHSYSLEEIDSGC